MNRLAGKIALITMDAYGLAEAVANAYAAEGARVVLAGGAANASGAPGTKVEYLALDLGSAESAAVGVADVVARYGKLDVVVNLAGDYKTSKQLHEVSIEAFDAAVAANISSILHIARAAIPEVRHTNGVIINLLHGAGMTGVPGTSVLAATRGGVANMTRDMALQGHREGFRVNGVSVGDSFIPVVPSLAEDPGRPTARASELASSFVYLATEESRHVSGHILAADDGMLAWIETPKTPSTKTGNVRLRAAPEGVGLVGGEIILVNGGAGGIGRATCKMLAAEGAKVVVADLNMAAAEAVAADIAACGGEAHAVQADALDPGTGPRIVAEAINKYGKLTGLINLVGFFGKAGATLDKVSLEEWKWMAEMNLRSVFLMTKAAVPELIKAGGGTITNVGTIAAVIARSGAPCYGTFKAGVLSLTRAMAADYSEYGIRVNALCPSATDTGMFVGLMSKQASGGTSVDDIISRIKKSDQGLSTPEQIAQGFIYLISEKLASRVTGQSLMLDHGFSLMRR